MARKTLAKLLLLTMLFEVLIVTEAKAWWRRRRRRCSSESPAGVSWANSWHGPISFTCGNNLSLRQWRSQHRNCKEDRIHYFRCGYGPVRYGDSDCDWSGHYVNDFDHPVNFKCPHNGFITGVKSTFRWHYRDRRFNFRCCHVNGFTAHSCKITPYQNNWDQEINYRVPSGYYLHGIYSYHDNGSEDRRWKFEVCQFTKFRPGK